MTISRHSIIHAGIVITNSSSTTGQIIFGSASAGIIITPSGFPSGTLSFYVQDEAANWKQLYDSSNAAITRVVSADRAYELPDELFSARAIRIVSTVDATGYTCSVLLKA
jgi:hypothetical protein